MDDKKESEMMKELEDKQKVINSMFEAHSRKMEDIVYILFEERAKHNDLLLKIVRFITGSLSIVMIIFVLFDMLVDKSRKANPIDKKTDWYFKNEKYEEELKARDKREDKNEYKFY